MLVEKVCPRQTVRDPRYPSLREVPGLTQLWCAEEANGYCTGVALDANARGEVYLMPYVQEGSRRVYADPPRYFVGVWTGPETAREFHEFQGWAESMRSRGVGAAACRLADALMHLPLGK